MPTMFEQWTWLVPALVLVITVGIGYFVVPRIPARRGGESSPEPKTAETWSPRKPSIERSATSSTASVTVQANPDRPLVYTVAPVNGSARLVRLTVVYEQSLDDSESAILRSGAFDSKPDEPPLDGVDDERWLNKVNQARKKL